MEEFAHAPKITRFHPRTLVLAIGALIVILITALFVMYYQYPNTWLGRFVGSKLPFPVILVDHHVILESKTLSDDVASIERFYASQDFSQLGIRVDFSTDDGKKRLKLRERDLLNKILEDAVVERLAQDQGIVISEQDAQADVEKRLKQYGAADKVEATIARLYGWTMRDFEEKVVIPSMYEEALAKKFEAQSNNDQSKSTIEAAQKELKKTNDFTATVAKYSDGRTKGNGGDLGWFTLEELTPELRSPVDVATLNVPTDIIESSLGYHIILVVETKNEDGNRMYHLRQIFVRKANFPDWVAEQIRQHSVKVLLSEYRFDSETGRIDFRSDEMKAFEKKLMDNPDSDPLFFY